MADRSSRFVPAGMLFIGPADAWRLMRGHRLKMLLVEQAARDGRRLDPETIALLDDLEAAAAAHTAAVSARVSLQAADISGHCGRPQPDPVEMLSTKAAAQRIGCSERQVRRLLESEQLPGSRKIKGDWKVDVTGLELYIERKADEMKGLSA